MYYEQRVALQVDTSIIFDDFWLDQLMPDIETVYDRRKALFWSEGPKVSPILSFQVISHSHYQMAYLRETLMWRPQSITCLGPGLVCQNCGSKNPSGVLRCVFCSGLVEEEDWITPMSLMGKRATRQNWSRPAIALDSEDPLSERWEIALDPDVDCDALVEAITGGKARILPVGSVLDEGLYLCHRCGRPTPIGETCVGCGGEQMPLSEIIKIDRKCLACGTKTTDGILCPRCGRAFASESYKQWAMC